MNNNIVNKESVQLLKVGSSDSDSVSDIQFSLAPQPTVQARRKVRTKRKPKGDAGKNQSDNPLGCSFMSIVKICSLTFTIGGILVLGWIVMILHSQVQQLTTKLDSLPQGYDDETLLMLKRNIKELGQNQTSSYNSLQHYWKVFEDFQHQLSSVSADVLNIKESLKEAPQMMNIGKELDSLKSSLASYEATIMELKSNFEGKDPSYHLANITSTISALNSTIEAKLNSVFEKLEHQHENLHLLKNNTEELSSKSSSIVKRLDAAQSAIVKLDSQQKNLTLTLEYLKAVVNQKNLNN